MRIGYLRTTETLYGGSQYEAMVLEALAARHDVEVFDASPRLRRAQRPQSILRSALLERKNAVEVWIRGETAVMAMTPHSTRAKNIAIAHHLDDAVGPIRFWNRALIRLWARNARRCERIVVVSKFWQQHLSKLGLQRILLIHNAFEVERFSVSPGAAEEFRVAHGLTGKPVIYIGNCQRKKGAPAVMGALRGQNYHLVTSGVSDVDLPVRKFLLPYDQYVLLLSACDVVVAMSQFKEGWSRTAHEALLCGTPVVGSGTGGMAELLEGAGQLVCQSVEHLPAMICQALANRWALGARGRSFASRFTAAQFNAAWLGLAECV